MQTKSNFISIQSFIIRQSKYYYGLLYFYKVLTVTEQVSISYVGVS